MQENPYSAPNQNSNEISKSPQKGKRIICLLAVAFAGIAIGSYISSELLFWHYPDEIRTSNNVAKNTIGGLITSPVGMTIGVLPTIRFYRSHGWLVFPGALMATIGSYLYFRNGKNLNLAFAVFGFILWSHNNTLSFQALMSV